MTKQKSFFKNSTKEYGGDLYKTRRGRQGPRPLATRQTLHLVLKSTRAKGDLSFRKSKNAHAIRHIVTKFASKYGIRIISLANVGNHLHFHIKLGNLRTYTPFIRAITAAIAMAITGRSRWQKSAGKFWDRRPFTRVIVGFRSWLGLQDYIRVNQLEGAGVTREHAEYIVREHKRRRSRSELSPERCLAPFRDAAHPTTPSPNPTSEIKEHRTLKREQRELRWLSRR